MGKHFLLSALFVVCGIGVISWFMPVQAAEINNEPDWSQCVKVYDGGKSGNGQTTIRLYNGCPRGLLMNVCVVSTDGEKKLYQSGQYIYSNRNYTIYTFPFVTPSRVQWSASTTQAIVPEICA